jgi:predicted RNA-binding Zn-ribbon protein involved in translation (DUF1610 family)
MQSRVRVEPLALRREVKTKWESRCPECGAEMVVKEGCYSCEACGWSKCSI